MSTREYRPALSGQRPAAYIHETYLGSISLPTLYVHEPDDTWQKTGLLDAAGHELMRRDKREPIGFLAGIRTGGGGR